MVVVVISHTVLLAALIAFCAVVSVRAPGGASHNHFVRDRRSHCGTRDLTPKQAEEDSTRMNSWKHRRRRVNTCARCIKVDTYFHVISDHIGTGNVTKKSIQKQIKVLNSAFKDTTFQFRLRGITRSFNNTWFNMSNPRTELGASIEKEMKMSLRQGGSTTLNIYSNNNNCCLGYASSPVTYSDLNEDDGVVILYSSLPGGALPSYNMGFTAVHEVGHWLGLLHVFSADCDGPGDMVQDTAPQRYPSYGCIARKDSCGFHPGRDNIHNFMDYSDDSCMSQFTAGQAERMTEQWYIYRQQDEECAPNEVLIDIDITLDSNAEEISWRIDDAQGNTFAESNYSPGTKHSDFDNKRFSTDFCVPVGSYTFIIMNKGGNGICCGGATGEYKIIVDGVLVKRGGKVETEEVIEINALQLSPEMTNSPPQVTTAPSARLPTFTPTLHPTALIVPATEDIATLVEDDKPSPLPQVTAEEDAQNSASPSRVPTALPKTDHPTSPAPKSTFEQITPGTQETIAPSTSELTEGHETPSQQGLPKSAKWLFAMLLLASGFCLFCLSFPIHPTWDKLKESECVD